MADDTAKHPKEPSPVEALEQLRQRRELDAKVKAAAARAFDDIITSFKARVEEYRTTPDMREDINTLAAERKTSPKNFIFELVVTELKNKLSDEDDLLEAAAVVALTSAASIPEAKRTGEVGALHDYITSPENETHNRNALVKALQAVSMDPPTSPLPENVDAPPILNIREQNPSVPVTFPDVTGGSARGGLGLPDDRTNDDIQTAVKKLFRDSMKIIAVANAARNATYAKQYASLDKPANKAFLQQLETAASNVKKAIEMTAVTADNRGVDGKYVIAVNDTNKELWKEALDEQTRMLNASLIKSETAKFAIDKARSKKQAKSQLAAAMRKTITEECRLNPDGGPSLRGLDPLDDMLTPPLLLEKLFHKHKKEIIGTAAVGLMGLASMIGVRSMSGKPDGPKDTLVAKNNVEEDPVLTLPEEKLEFKIPPEARPVAPEIEVSPMPPKVEAQDPPPPMQAAPKPEEPQKEPPKTVEVPEVPIPREVVPPKVEPAMGTPEDNPMGKKERDLRALFEKNHIDDFVLANPDVVPRGFVELYDDHYKVAENYRVSYLQLQDVTRGVYVLYNADNGHIMIAPPANKRIELALVQNPKPKRGPVTYHLSEIIGGNENVLKNQLGENIDFRIPEAVQPNKFMTGETVREHRSPIIEVGAYYLGGKDERKDQQRVAGVESPIIRPAIPISGIAIGVHSGMGVDMRGVRLDPQQQSSRSRGPGDPADAHVIGFKGDAQESLIMIDPYPNICDLGHAEIVQGINGGWDTPGLQFDGLAIPVPHGGILPSSDPRKPQQRDLTSSPNGASQLYVLPGPDVSLRVARGIENPVSYKQGAPVTTRQVAYIEQFIQEIEHVLEPQEGQAFSFGEFAARRIQAERMLSETKWARLEPPRAHSRLLPHLTPGAFGPDIPGLRQGDKAERYCSNSLILKDEEQNKQHTWLDELLRAVQALGARATDAQQLALTKKAAGEKFEAAELLRADAGRIADDSDPKKSTLLSQAYDAEAEAARLLSVPYPDPLGNTDDATVKAAHAKAVTEARTTMKILLRKTPQKILQECVEALLQKEKDPRTHMLESVDDHIEPSAMRAPLKHFRDILDDPTLKLAEPEKRTLIRLYTGMHRYIIEANTVHDAITLLDRCLNEQGHKNLAMKLRNDPRDTFHLLTQEYRNAAYAGNISNDFWGLREVAAKLLGRPPRGIA